MVPPRAPRLAPDQRIAAHITRVGRFRAVNPARPKRPPTLAALFGRLGWALLVEESLRRAWRRSRGIGGGAGAAGLAED